MKFSVIVPVYNVERFLPKCLDSVLAQDFCDYEIVAVDDGSKDGSGQILHHYLEKTNRLRIIHQENKGLGGARNTGIDAAQGDYLLLLDSDDTIEPNTLTVLAEYLDRYDLDILAFDCLRVNEDGSVIERVTTPDYTEKYTPLTGKKFLLLEPTGCTKVYRRSLFVDNMIRFPEKLWYEDLATVFRLAPFTDKVGYLKEPLYLYVQQSGSITHSTNTSRMMEITTAFNMEIDFYKKIGAFETYRAELEWNCALHVMYYSAFRLLGCGYHHKQMHQLFSYSYALFPDIEKNEYVLRKAPLRYLMSEVMEGKLFRFYWKVNVIPNIVQLIKTVTHWDRWKKGDGTR